MSNQTSRSIWTRPLFGKAAPRSSKAIIAAAPVEAEVKTLITKIVRRTRLKFSEKSDVATELLAHFQDATAAGISATQAIAAFGDPVPAARLIRRAKIRQRSLLWHSLRAIRYATATLVILYLGVGVYLYFGKPNPTVDYIAKLNAPALAVPEESRAWPLYREALIRLPPWSMDGSFEDWQNLLDRLPQSNRFTELESFIALHKAEFELIRRGTERPIFGFIVGRRGSGSDQAMFPPDQVAKTRNPYAAVEGSVLAEGFSFQGLSVARLMANLLVAECRVAIAAGDSALAVKDTLAMAALSEQLRTGVLIDSLVAVGIHALAVDLAAELLRDHGAALSDADLNRLAHRFSKAKTPSDLITLRGERYFFYDVIQRTFTDDGKGDGRLTSRGMLDLSAFSGTGHPTRPDPDTKTMLIAVATGGASQMFIASRKEMVAEYERLMNECELKFKRSFREADWAQFERDVTNRRLSMNYFRYLPVHLTLPLMSRFAETAERLLGLQEGLVVAIAIEAYHRTERKWPERLDMLVPTYLPAVPIDRVSGNPLKYCLGPDGKPRVYSVGPDLKDDHGQYPPKTRGGQKTDVISSMWNLGETKPVDGDWVLYPRLPAEPEPENDEPLTTQPSTTRPN